MSIVGSFSDDDESMCLLADPASADDELVYFDSIESASFEPVTSKTDEFYDCASFILPSFWDYFQSYLAYPLLGLPVFNKSAACC